MLITISSLFYEKNISYFIAVSLSLPAIQEELLSAVVSTGKPVIVVLMNGGPVSSPGAWKKTAAMVVEWIGRSDTTISAASRI